MARKRTTTAARRVPPTLRLSRVALALSVVAILAGIVGLGVATHAGPRAVAEGEQLAAWVRALWPYQGAAPS